LLWCDRCQALCLEEFNTGSLIAQVGLQANENNGCGGTEVQNLRIPLGREMLENVE
jgi:hypothetical protein